MKLKTQLVEGQIYILRRLRDEGPVQLTDLVSNKLDVGVQNMLYASLVQLLTFNMIERRRDPKTYGLNYAYQLTMTGAFELALYEEENGFQKLK